VSRAAVPRGGMRFIAWCSLSLPSEAPVKRLRRHGFGALPPGIESWHDPAATSCAQWPIRRT